MAKQTTITLIDDIDGESAADETVTFSLDGTAYEIDLTEAHAQQLREAFETYTSAARRAGRSAAPKPGRKPAAAPSNEPSADGIRTWAKAHGFKVSERGRMSAEVRDAYAAAH
jgi:hypothetical protein